MQHIPLSFDASPVWLILLGAVFVHACFQLSVSVLTLLSSHSIGRRLSHGRLFNLNFWYILGVVSAVTALQLAATSLLRTLMAYDVTLVTALSFGVIPFVALLMVLFYYRRGRGTKLWLPRPAADYITTRAKKTKSSIEAYALGITTAVTELPFALAPIVIVAFSLQSFSAHNWFALSAFYAIAVSSPLIFVALFISSGHKLSSVQKWREDSKDFLKWTSAATLLLLTIYLTVLRLGDPV